jgi:SAM-dependent methyltransferase
MTIKSAQPVRSRPGVGSLRAKVSPFDTMASRYDAWFEDEGKLIFAIEVEAFRKYLPLLPKPWLEVGVGSGRFAQALGIEIGIDPSRNLLKMARTRGINVSLSKGEERFFDEETFGTIFLIVTLCFVDSPLAVLQQAYRILKPKGKLVLGLVLRGSSWGQFYMSKKKKGHHFYGHANFYSYDEMVKLLEQTGFTVEKVLSTLFQKPCKVTEIELPKEGFSPDAGFTIVMATKAPKRSKNQTKRPL